MDIGLVDFGECIECFEGIRRRVFVLHQHCEETSTLTLWKLEFGGWTRNKFWSWLGGRIREVKRDFWLTVTRHLSKAKSTWKISQTISGFVTRAHLKGRLIVTRFGVEIDSNPGRILKWEVYFGTDYIEVSRLNCSFNSYLLGIASIN